MMCISSTPGSVSRPGGNITGVIWVATVLVPKQLELLRRVFVSDRRQRPLGAGVWETAMCSCPLSKGKSHVPIRFLHDHTA